MLDLLLKNLGSHEVFMSYDGAAALEEAERRRPDIILLDIGLPKMDGYQVANRLRRQSRRFKRTLVVALTGYGTDEDRRKSLAAGFDEPLGMDALQKVLSHPKLARV
jgi:CheY-like chemotaxis protein